MPDTSAIIGTGTIPEEVIYRHPLAVRLWHWITAAAIFGLLFTGFNILNIHPRLYWGEVGNAGTEPIVALDPGPSAVGKAPPSAILRIGSYRWNVSGIMGVPLDFGADGTYYVITSTPDSWHFGGMRAWHFAVAWVLGISWVLYGLYLLVGGRLRRSLIPTRPQLRPRAILMDVWNHLRMRRSMGAAAREYNLLQKISYLVILGVVIPIVILTGLTMSNGITARVPELYALFGGRQSARTLHALGALLITLFIVIHIVQAFVGGIVNEIRSITTGYFVVPSKDRS